MIKKAMNPQALIKANNNVITLSIALLFLIASSSIPVSESSLTEKLFPRIEVTLSNDDEHPIWYMCQMTDKADSLYQLPNKTTYRFSFSQIAFPMRWCYLYINPDSHGFFWVYTVRSRCTKCFWSINKHPLLYRGDKTRWERQKLFMPEGFSIIHYMKASLGTSGSNQTLH